MRLKSFTAASATEAMAQIRAVLGDRAVIVATREDENGGIRVTAAVDEPEIEAQPAAPAIRPVEAPPPASAVDAAYRAFRTHGVPAIIGERLLDLVAGIDTDDPATALAAALRQTFRFAPMTLAGTAERREPSLMVVGPPGAGKTQTLAKMAAAAVMAGRQVCLITTDTARAGGAGRLPAFAEALQLTVAEADGAQALADTLRRFAGVDLALVDSAGRNHFDGDEMADLCRLAGAGSVEPVLVVPAGLDAVEAGDIGAAYKDIGASRVIANRLDMTRRLGSVLAVAYGADLAFAGFGITARIKDGLMPADALSLARLFLSPRRPDSLRAPHTGTARP